MSDVKKRVSEARASLILDSPFFGALALRLKVEEDPSCDTAWVNGQTMGFNPAFVASLTHNQLVGLVAHEVMHAACGHPWRRDNRDQGKFNKACAYAVNPILVDAGFTVPENSLLDPDFHGKSAEWIYDRLPDSDGDGGSGGQPGQGQNGEVRDAPTAQEESDQTPPTESDWQQAVRQAAAVAKARGALPASLDRNVADATRPRADWRSVLARFVQQAAQADYSWSHPNRRYFASGLFLPGLRSQEMGPMAVVTDSSGSVDDVLLGQFNAELQAIVDAVQPLRVHVLSCDSAVQSHEVFERGDPVRVTAKGGGGTDFRPAFAAIADINEPVVAVVYMSDLDGVFPDREPDVPVLWACVGDRKAPFGELVRLD